MASPAEIVRQCLVNQGLVVAAPFTQTPRDGTTLCFVGSMPDGTEQAVLVVDGAGFRFGRRQKDGKTLLHPGVNINIRALDYPTGYALANSVAAALDAVNPGRVTVGTETHVVNGVYRTSPLVSLGEEVGKKTQLWSVHARVVLADTEPVLG